MKKYSYLFLAIFICTIWFKETQAQEKDFVINGDTPWIIDQPQPEPVQRAIDDVGKDWYKVFGQRPFILQSLPEGYKGGAIYLGLTGNWKEDLVRTTLEGPESFTLELNQDELKRPAFIATGNDIRGAIYAIYSFAEHILGVNPWYYWIDKEPEAKESISIQKGYSKQWSQPTFRFRGWFINDEDQLSYSWPDPLKENVIALAMYDKIYETILRLKGNMVDPATFLMPDERCQELAARRGLILNMHHANPLGLNTYRWPKDLPYSYNKHPEIFEKMWQQCIDAYKDFEVIWTVGYRGKHDRPFWIDEKGLDTPQKQGELISRVIAKQVEMIRKSRPNDIIVSNMWMEGVPLYLNGYLKLPKDVILIWPDNGAGIIHDRGTVKEGNGIYYHTAMIDRYSNQITEMVYPHRARRELGRFIDAGATTFFMLNVSDIRSVPLTTDYLMKMVWDAKPYMEKSPEQNQNDHIKEWCIAQYGPKAAKSTAPLYENYFAIAYMQDGIFRGEASLCYRPYGIHRSIDKLIAQKKKIPEKTLKEINALYKQANDNLEYIKNLLTKATKNLSAIPQDRQSFYIGHLLTQTRIHYYMLKMNQNYCAALLEYQNGNNKTAIEYAQEALIALKTLHRKMQQAEYGKWAAWYGGNTFIYMEQCTDIVRTFIAHLTGETTLPIKPFRGYPQVFQYQVPHLQNFPLFYPQQ